VEYKENLLVKIMVHYKEWKTVLKKWQEEHG